MANRYWVGGTANWDGTAGTKWAETSGGTGGASVPTLADDVFFDANSGAVTVTVTSTRYAKSIDCTGFTGTLAGSSGAIINVYGNVTFVEGMTLAFSGATSCELTLNATGTLTTAGKQLSRVTVSAPSNTVTLGDALTTTYLYINQGTFTTNNFNVTAALLQSSTTNTRTINLGSSIVTLNNSGGVWNVTTTNLTLNSDTSTIIFPGSGPVLTSVTGITTFHNVSFTSTDSNTTTITGNFIFNNFSVSAPLAVGIRQVTFNTFCTINGTLSTTGTAGNRRVWFRGITYGLAQTLTVNSAPSLTDADFRDIYVVGTAAPISGTRIGDLRGCIGITFSSPKTVYWVTASSGNWSGNNWAASSGGAASTDYFPLAQDTAVIDNTGLNTSATVTLDTAIPPQIGTLDMSGRTSAMTLFIAFNPNNIYGDWINGSGTNISGSYALTFCGRRTQTITSAGKTFPYSIAIDTYGGTVELADALNIAGSNSLGVNNGTFDTKNYNVTAGVLSSNNSNVRTITLGSSTVTLSGSGNIINFSTPTNLTFNAGTSTINLNITSAIFQGGGQTFYNVTATAPTSISSSYFSFYNTSTFNNLTLIAPTQTALPSIIFYANQTITGTLSVTGTTVLKRVRIVSSSLGSARTLTVGALSTDDCDFRDIIIAGAAAGSSPTRAGDCGGNSGITFPSPKTVYWNLAGTQNWSATGWASSSGGTPDINNFPLAQDTAVFDDTGSADTVTIDQPWNIGTFDASARTSAMTLTTGSNTPFVYGDWKFGTGVTSSSASGAITFAKRGTQTITSNGVTFGCPVTVDSIIGTVQLADAFSTDSSRILTLTTGAFDAVTYNVTTGQFSTVNSNNRTLKMGSGTWTFSGFGNVLDVNTNGLIFYKGTANILLSNTSTTDRFFYGGGLSYNKLTIGGTTGISTLTIIGNNQFTEFASTKTVAHTIALGSTTQTFGKWTVTGTAGNVVTLTGTGLSHVLAGSCTDSIDYLAMGSIGFAATSPGEFYAGANSTGTASAPVYRTVKPADSTRYWVGGTGNWSDTARWSTSSGGGSGASVPRSHDDVVFDSASNATAYTATVNAVTGGIRMKSLTIAGPASGNVTLAGSQPLIIHDDVTLPSTGMTRTYTGAITLSGSTSGNVLTTNGVTLASAITVNGVSAEWALGSALDTSLTLTVTNGLFDTVNYNITAGTIASNSSNTRTINFGSSTVTIIGNVNFGTTETERETFTFNCGTSQINCTNSGPVLAGNGKTFYNVAFTSTSAGTVTISGTNIFNDLSFAGITSVVGKSILIYADQTVTGTLTLSAGTNATMRNFVRTDTIGSTRTLTCAAVDLTDVDFRDITIAGAAAPATGTRIGDCKGNSGITFTVAANKYWNLAAGGNWGGAIGWATSSGGTPDINNFPLAQDTCFFEATGLNSGATITVNQNYHIGTIDMSARTANTMTLATSTNTVSVYGNWINGTGTTITGTGSLYFVGRNNQTITSAGRTFTQNIQIYSIGGTVTLQDALSCGASGANAILLEHGTFDAVSYNVTFNNTLNTFYSSFLSARTLSIGSGTWTIPSSSSTSWNCSSSANLTVTGTGTINMTGTGNKTFIGGDIDYSGITLNQGGAGSLTVTGNNTFKTITNTYKTIGATTINFGTTTTRLTDTWLAAGESGRILTITGNSDATPCNLIYTGSGTAARVNYLNVTYVKAFKV